MYDQCRVFSRAATQRLREDVWQRLQAPKVHYEVYAIGGRPVGETCPGHSVTQEEPLTLFSHLFLRGSV